MALIERNHYRDEEPEAFPPGAIPISRRPRKDQGFQFRNDFEPVRVEIANVVMHVLMEDSKRPRADSRRKKVVVGMLLALLSIALCTSLVLLSMTVAFLMAKKLTWAVTAATAGLIMAGLFIVAVQVFLDARRVFRGLELRGRI